MIDREVLLSCVRVSSGNQGGSGTVLYCGPDGEGGHSTYVLTNFHVVDNNVKLDKKWSTLLKREVKIDILGMVYCEFFRYRWESRTTGSQAEEADIVTYDKDEDLALLRLRTDSKVDAVAKLYPKGKEKDMRLAVPVVAIGAALGESPIISVGRLAQFGKEIENREYWISTAPTIFGNSGGAVFLEETAEFIGVPSRVAIRMIGFAVDPIPHLSYMIPITRVYHFLDEQLFRFIYDPKFTEAGELAEREKRRREEELKMAAREETTGEDTEGK